MSGEQGLETLSWDELKHTVEQFIATDGPNTDDLAADEFFSLWAQFEAERRLRVIEIKGEVVGEEVHLALAPSNIVGVEVKGNEIRLPDGTRIVLHLRSARPAAI